MYVENVPIIFYTCRRVVTVELLSKGKFTVRIEIRQTKIERSKILFYITQQFFQVMSNVERTIGAEFKDY